MEANARAAGRARRRDVLGAAVGRGGVGEEDDRRAGRAIGGLVEAVADAFLGEQAADEVEVALAVLHAVAAHAAFGGAGEQLADAGRPAPAAVGGVVAEHGVDDVGDVALLPNAAAQRLREKTDPRLHDQAVAREAAVAVLGRGLQHHAAAAMLGAIGGHGDQRRGLREHGVEIERSVLVQRDELQVPGLAQRLLEDEGLDLQAGECARAFDTIETCGAVEQPP